eukprot:g7166.t1
MSSNGKHAAPLMSFCSLLLMAGTALAYRPNGGPATTASGCPAEMPDSEDVRVSGFRDVYGTWPPRVQLGEPSGPAPQRETAGWRAYHRRKEAKLMQIDQNDWRWERWLEQVQIRTLTNFTETGWAMGRMPAEVHEQALAHFRREHRDGQGGYDEGTVAGYIGGKRRMVGMGDTQGMITRALQRLVGEWSGLGEHGIEPTSTYGTRVYYEGSTLETHVDRVETHV